MAGVTESRLPPTMCEWLLPLAARALADGIRDVRDSGESARGLQDELAAIASEHPSIIRDLGEPTPLWESQIQALGDLYLAEQARGWASDDEPERWLAAADALHASRLPWEATYARTRAAAALLEGDRDRSRGAVALRDALERAEDLQAAALERELRALARRARIAAGRPRPIGVGSRPTLTPREREILSLVVAGRTYGEIARELVISEKTVSTHISHLLDKTGTANRVELAGFAERVLSASSD